MYNISISSNHKCFNIISDGARKLRPKSETSMSVDLPVFVCMCTCSSKLYQDKTDWFLSDLMIILNKSITTRKCHFIWFSAGIHLNCFVMKFENLTVIYRYPVMLTAFNTPSFKTLLLCACINLLYSWNAQYEKDLSSVLLIWITIKKGITLECTSLKRRLYGMLGERSFFLMTVKGCNEYVLLPFVSLVIWYWTHLSCHCLWLL